MSYKLKQTHASSSSPSSSSRCTRCRDRQQGGNGNVYEEKLVQLIYECFFDSSVSLSGVTHLSQSDTGILHRNITWIGGTFAIGWTHKLCFIMSHKFFFIWTKRFPYSKQQQNLHVKIPLAMSIKHSVIIVFTSVVFKFIQ